MTMASSPKLIGKYEILEELGRGGFAVVYKARDVELDRIVALKVLRPALSDDPDFVARFKQEARAAARLQHPDIVVVHDATQIDGQLIIAMQYVEGRTLRDELTQGILPPDRVLAILEQIAGALDYAHQHGVVHRDVKPANILLEDTDQGVHATLLDFGLAKAMEASTALTSQGTLLGSPEYMAPEQADSNRAKEIGPATDRYALGIVAYQLLTGRVPFPGNTPATLHDHLHSTPPDPHVLRSEVSPQVGAVLLKMLAKAPAERYASAREFVAALRQAAAPPVIHAIPRQTSRWVWGALLGVLAVVAVGIILSLILSQPENQVIPTPRTTVPVFHDTATVPPSPTNRPASTDTPVPTPVVPSPVPAPGVGSQRLRATDGVTMVYVPAGTFKMGSDSGDSDEKPVHDVTLDAFWIDRTEVTNAQYAQCVSAGQCAAPPVTKSATGASYYGNSQYGNYPVIYVSLNDADKYCKWAGGHLPTEAQWEYAARGPQSVTYPWGNDRPNDTLLNYNQKIGDATSVGSYPRGASWVGAFDMAGNVWEWVQDWYGAYSDSAQTNPTGPASGNTRVLRGGSWNDDGYYVRAALRNNYGILGLIRNDVGFRCVVAPGE
jgi:eukaryotic-like serine/threonine-protein kinase